MRHFIMSLLSLSPCCERFWRGIIWWVSLLYRLLPKMFQDVSDKELELISDNDELFDYERAEINKALFKYCELDTMAMVMLVEGWMDLVG